MFLNRNCLLIILLLYIVTGIALGQHHVTTADENDRLSMTYTYFVAQQASLESVIDRYPALQDRAVNATIDWKKEFGPAIKIIDSCLYKQKGETWSAEKEKIYDKYRRADHSNVSEKEALNFIEIIFQRSFGKIQTPVLETLLSYKPEYIKNPEKEFSDGYVNNYFSSTTKKTNPVNIRIVYPKSWKAVSGVLQSNIQQVFISHYGTGKLALSFQIERTPNIPAERIPALLTENSLKNYCLKTDSVIQYTPGLDIDFCSAAGLSYIRKEVDIDKQFTIYFETYHSYYKNHHFALLFSYKSDVNNLGAIKTEFEKYRKLIRKILFNVVILSQWEQKKI